MENTEKRILENAAGQFFQYGYRKTNLDDIVQDLKISKATIYNYFKNKEDLFKQFVKFEYKNMFDSMKSAIETEPDPSKQLILYVLKRADYACDFFSKRGCNNAIIKELIETRDQLDIEGIGEIDILKEIIKAGESKNIFKKNSHHHADLLYKIITQFELRWFRMKPLEYREEIQSLFNMLLHGILK